MTTATATASSAPAAPVTGLWLALVSAASFGTSGSFGKSLLEAGWSPGAAVAARIGGAALVMVVPTVLAARGHGASLRRHAGLLVAYGAFAMAACQLCFFNAVTRLSVGVALLLEYLAPLLIIAWLWLRSGVRPSRLTLIGTAVSMAGLVLVLNLTTSVDIDIVGVAWALGAAVCLVIYFLLSAREAEGLPPIVMAGAGLVVAAAIVVALGLAGVMPLEASTADVEFAGRPMSWLVPLAGMVVVATAVPYFTGIVAVRRLGSRLASFVGLTEVLFAVLFAWLVLGELPLVIQLAGGLLIVAGVTCIRYDELVAREPTLPSGGTALPLPDEEVDTGLPGAAPFEDGQNG